MSSQQLNESDSSTSEKSALPSSPSPSHDDIVPKRYFFGAQGKALTRQIAIAGSIGFLLFGYDQGVLGGLNAAEEFLRQFNYPSSSLL
ncbi:hypothetical protein ABEF95_014689 [Exophiala dermatitidis]